MSDIIPSLPTPDHRVVSRIHRLLPVFFILAGCILAFRAVTPQASAISTHLTSIALGSRELKPDTERVPSQNVLQKIQDIQLGQRVVGRNPLRHETHSPSEIEPNTWRRICLTMIQDGVTFDLEFLRSLDWIQSVSAQPRGTIYLELPGIGLDGPATVDSIGPCPLIEPDDGTGRMVVTGRMNHLAPNVCEVSVSGLDEPFGVTSTHPIWSETRQAFVFARDLQPGEALKTASGTLATVISVHPKRGPPEFVYNLEIDGEHVYHVASNALLVHNDSVADVHLIDGGHVAIEVFTDQGRLASDLIEPGGKGVSVIRNAIAYLDGLNPKQLNSIRLSLTSGPAAQELMSTLFGTTGKFLLGENSCVTHVIDILKAGGVDVSSLPRTIGDGFWEALLRMGEPLP